MNPTFEMKLKGRLLYCEKKDLYIYYKGKIYKSNDGANSWTVFYNLPVSSFFDRLAYKIDLISRLLRKGVHHLCIYDKEQLCFIYNKNVCVVQDRQILLDKSLSGSRPLSFERIGDKIFFGEYRSNPERTPVSVFCIDMNKKLSIKKVFTFNKIRHIHGIYKDPYSKNIYITTGDNNNEAAIYKTEDEFESVEKILSGSQQTRTIKLLFDEFYIYFGTDSPEEQNYLYKLDKNTNKLIELTKVGSSVFHGCKVSNWLFFSTAIEPSKVNNTQKAEIWASPDGDNWKCIFQFKKDFLPMKYFQYGQVFFPQGNGDGENLWLSPLSTKNSQRTKKVSLTRIARQFY